ncbi:MAG: hypothetical protein WD894_13740 [Pirellulales bacterium]
MNAIRRTLVVWGCLAILPSTFNLRAADEASGESKLSAPSSLDEQLLEGLDDQPAPKAANTKQEASRSTGKSSLDDELLRDLGGDLGGEDVGAPGASPDPLVPIGRRMRTVESRLADQKLDGETSQLQQQILADLATLMQECKKQCQGGAGKPGSKPGKSGKGSQAGSSPVGQAPADTARDSSDKLRDRQTQRGENGALVNAMKESWGNLPEHARKHLANVNTDVFLPKYELMLEKYFKRLGEEDANER